MVPSLHVVHGVLCRAWSFLARPLADDSNDGCFFVQEKLGFQHIRTVEAGSLGRARIRSHHQPHEISDMITHSFNESNLHVKTV